MNADSIHIYGFVVDTACYNRNFDNPSVITDINQGACCLTDKVRSMFGQPKIIKDPRESRVGMGNLTKITEDATFADHTLELRLKSDDTKLNGIMSIVYDGGKVDPVVQSMLDSSDTMKLLFDAIEVMGQYQVFENDEDRVSQDLDAVSTVARGYLERMNANAAILTDETEQGYVENVVVQHVIKVNNVPTVFETKRLVREYATIEFIFKDSNNREYPIALHLYWGVRKILSLPENGGYPLSTITDVVFPCEKSKLYELLEAHHVSISEFASASSKYRTDRINEIMASDDHSGVYNFTTDYYAYPDTQPTNHFNLSFGCVYKGAKPNVDDVKARLRDEILAIVPTHSEDEWRKKLPGIISERQFFIIPLYGNKWNNDSHDGPFNYGIVDLALVSNFVQRHLSTAYSVQSKYAQLIEVAGDYNLCIVVPKLDQTLKKISDLYRDYTPCGVEDDRYQYMSEPTKDFIAHFLAALGYAYSNQGGISIADINGSWVSFVSQDGVEYYVMTANSYIPN